MLVIQSYKRLQLPEELMEEVCRLATENQVSLEQSPLAAIAEVGAEQTVRMLRYFSGRANYSRFDEILARVPDTEPILGDAL